MASEEELEQRALSWPDRARALVVQDDATMFAAGEELLGIKALRAEIEAVFGPVVKKAYEAHRAAVMARKNAEDPLIEAETILKLSLSVYEIERRRRQEDEQRTERERQELEAQRERQAELNLARTQGATPSEISEMANRPLPAPIVVPQKPFRSPAINMRDNWKVVVEDKQKLVRYCASNPDHLGFVDPNYTTLNALARALKSAMNIPGVKVLKEAIVAARNRS